MKMLLHGILHLIQQRDCLDVGCAGKHIEGAGRGYGITASGQPGAVAGKAGRVAGDIDDPFGSHAADGVGRQLVHAFAGRVGDDDVGVQAALGQLIGRLTGVAQYELGIIDAVARRALAGVFHSLWNDLASDGPAAPAGKQKGYRAGATVEIEGGIAFGQPGGVEGRPIEMLGLEVVDLIKGHGRQTKLEAHELIPQLALTPEGDAFIAHYLICMLRVYIEHDALEVAPGLAGQLHQPRQAGQALSVSHDAQKTSARPLADINMANKAASALFIIWLHAKLVHPAADGAGQLV